MCTFLFELNRFIFWIKVEYRACLTLQNSSVIATNSSFWHFLRLIKKRNLPGWNLLLFDRALHSKVCQFRYFYRSRKNKVFGFLELISLIFVLGRSLTWNSLLTFGLLLLSINYSGINLKNHFVTKIHKRLFYLS